MYDEDTRVLVVDDDRGIREGCCRVLEKAGYEVITADDGERGLNIFAHESGLAAAVVDLQLPGIDGIELTRRMHEVDEDCVLLIITGYASIETAVQAIKQGAYGYISKPFAPDELLLQLGNGLKKRALEREAQRLREEREKSLVEIAQERSRCSTIIKCMADGVLVVNRDRKIVLRNSAATRVFNGASAPPLPCQVDDLTCPVLSGLIESIFDAEEVSFILSKELSIGDGTYMVNISPVTEASGEKCGAVVVLRDITARKKLETAKSMFVSMVSHEIQSPLAVVEGYLGIIQNDTMGNDREQYSNMLGRSLLRVRALREMVSELMNLTAIETGNFAIKRSAVDINEVLTCAMDGLRDKAESKAIEISMTTVESSGNRQVFVDRNAMQVVFKNLIENAVKYTPQGGNVKVTVEENGLYARVRIKDNGFGMKPEEKAKIFDEFYRAKNGLTARIPGTGLGLSLVKRLLDLQDGTVSVSSKYSKGSEFTVCIPLCD